MLSLPFLQSTKKFDIYSILDDQLEEWGSSGIVRSLKRMVVLLFNYALLQCCCNFFFSFRYSSSLFLFISSSTPLLTGDKRSKCTGHKKWMKIGCTVILILALHLIQLFHYHWALVFLFLYLFIFGELIQEEIVFRFYPPALHN